MEIIIWVIDIPGKEGRMADSARKKFRKILERPGTTIIPGAHDALTARLIASKGFEAVYMSGAGVVNALAGLPDNGLASFSEVLMNARYMADAVDIPLVVDVDTGYGNAVNVVRTVRDFERAGVACIQIEDQVLPKRCGHLDGKQVVGREEFIGKIRAAVNHRTDPDFAVMARIDAKYVHGMEEAVERGNASLEAGADVIFIEALETRDEFAEYAERCPGPLLANMTEFGKTPHISKADFGEMGYKLVLFPVSIMRAMLKAGELLLDELKEKGTMADYLENMMTREELYRLLDYDAYHEIEAEYLPRE